MKGCMQLKSVNSWEDFHLQCVANPLDSWGGGGGGGLTTAPERLVLLFSTITVIVFS